MTLRLRVDNKIYVALPVERDCFGAMTCDVAESHALEKAMEEAHSRSGAFHEFEYAGADRVFPEFLHRFRRTDSQAGSIVSFATICNEIGADHFRRRSESGGIRGISLRRAASAAAQKAGLRRQAIDII